MKSIHHSFDIDLAKEHGIEEAILIHHFQYWINFNKRMNRNFKEGQTWMYQTQKEMQSHFPYMSLESIKYTIENLITKKIIVRKKFNKNPIDKTWWYAFVNEEEFIKSKNVYDTENSVSTREIPAPIPDTKSQDTKKSSSLPPPSKKSSSSQSITKEEEDEISQRIKKRPSDAIPIKNMKKYKEACVKSIREEQMRFKEENDRINHHIEEARKYQDKKINGDLITLAKNGIEITCGTSYRFIEFSLSDEEWKKQTQRWFIKLP